MSNLSFSSHVIVEGDIDNSFVGNDFMYK